MVDNYLRQACLGIQRPKEKTLFESVINTYSDKEKLHITVFNEETEIIGEYKSLEELYWNHTSTEKYDKQIREFIKDLQNGNYDLFKTLCYEDDDPKLLEKNESFFKKFL
jgi:hypothetical protein